MNLIVTNDVQAFEELTAEDLDRASSIHVPVHFHADPMGTTFKHWKDVLPEDWSKPVRTYRMHTDPNLGIGERGTFGRVRSVSDTAIASLLSLGFKTILTSGIETDGSGGYHPMFTRKVPKKRSAHRVDIWGHTKNRIKKANATHQRWENSGWCPVS